MRRRTLTMCFSIGACILIAGCGVAAQAAEQGPRLSDAELIEAVNFEFPGMQAVARAAGNGDQKAALAALADFFRQRREPCDFCPKQDFSPAIRSEADEVLRHEVTSVGIPYKFAGAIDWYFNPTTAPGSKLPRDYEWMWQRNRHHEWATLAEAYRGSGDERYAREFADQLRSWLRDCPVPRKGAWNAPGSPWRTIECGIRTAGPWPTALAAFRASPSVSDRLLLDWLKSWIEHGRYLSRHPTHGNWLTMEMNGLYHVGTLAPFAREAERWRAAAAERLRKEMSVQVYPDGAQYELTPGYHNVALRNMLGIYKLARAYGQTLPTDYAAGLEKMFAYDMWAMQPDGDMPHWNDSGCVDVAEVLAEGAALFPKRRDFLWIASGGKQGTPPDHTSHFFPWAGQVVMRCGWDRDALFLGFEVGPFGAGHQHEDKLSLVIVVGRPVLVEGGTYDYDASKWRRYVLSSLAHNLVLVDGAGQQRRKRPDTKLSKGPIDADFQSSDVLDFARGVYDDGFERGIRARHTREVLFDKANKLFVVRDQLAALDDKEHRYEALWHLDAPRLSCDPNAGVYETQIAGGANLRVVVEGGNGLRCRVVKGQEQPVVQGWLPTDEPRRGVRPIPCLICSRNGKRVEFLTVFQPLKTGKERRVARVGFHEASVEVIWSDSHTTAIAWPR